MSENTKENTFFAVVTAEGDVNFITNAAERRRYVAGLLNAATIHNVLIKTAEYHASAFYVILSAQSAKTALNVIQTANHSYGSFMAMKEGGTYQNMRFRRVYPVCLNEKQESMVRRALYLSMRF